MSTSHEVYGILYLQNGVRSCFRIVRLPNPEHPVAIHRPQRECVVTVSARSAEMAGLDRKRLIVKTEEQAVRGWLAGCTASVVRSSIVQVSSR